MKFADPRNDLAFKKIFGNENKREILISFLNAILDLKDERAIRQVELTSPYQTPLVYELKNTLLDVKATDQSGRQFIVEMQVERNRVFAKRSLYYTSKSYVNQLEAGEDYHALKKVYFIGILDFSTFDCESYLSRHLILDRETFANELQDFEFTFVELEKFHLSLSECRDNAAKWIYFIKNAKNLKLMPDEYKGEPAFEEAFEAAKKFNWDKDELFAYDILGMKATSQRLSFEHQLEEAVEKAVGKAVEKTKNETLLESKLEIARNLLDVMDDETISIKTGLQIEVVKELRQKH